LAPKFGLSPDRAAIGLPIGFAFGLFALGGEGGFGGLAGNLGLGISTDLDQWAIRPEIGIQFYPGDEGHYRQASIALSGDLGR
jgi:hypothetical protein